MKGIDVAESKLGMQETTNRKELIAFFKKYAINGDIVLDPSTTPWCASFVNACERQVGNKGTGRQNARSFLTYGKRVALKDAQKGDIVIFKRGNSSWQGHVAYFLFKQAEGIIVLGGNQKDSVCKSFYSLDSLLDIRRP